MSKVSEYLRWRRCRQRVLELERLARDLIDAVKANELQVSSNDLGNAVDAMEEALDA